MKEERITFRVTQNQKEELILLAKRYNMKLSEYIMSCINDKKEIGELNDSQGQFLSLFNIALIIKLIYNKV